MREVRVGDHLYRLGVLDARQQMHCFRRIAPVVTAAGALLPTLLDRIARNAPAPREDGEAAPLATAENIELLGAVSPLLTPMMEALAALPDAEVDYVLDACLGKVQRQIDGGRGWAEVSAGRGVMMFNDIGLMQMLELAGRVLIGETGSGGIGDFFGERLSNSAGEKVQASA